MKIEGEHKELLSAVHLALTVEEAKELRDTLDILLKDPRPNRHEHVSSADFQTEISVRIVSP